MLHLLHDATFFDAENVESSIGCAKSTTAESGGFSVGDTVISPP